MLFSGATFVVAHSQSSVSLRRPTNRKEVQFDCIERPFKRGQRGKGAPFTSVSGLWINFRKCLDIEEFLP